MITLRDMLPHEAHTEEHLQPLLDVEVTVVHMSWLPGDAWPGRHRHVMNWWTLVNGKRVGWNENPAVGWSFPVLGKSK